MFSNDLEAMVQMGDGEVRRENRHGIAEDQVIASEEDPFLTFREMIQAEETSPLVYIFFAHIGQAALDPSGIVLKSDRKSFAG
jgi:hypothetical protein